MSMASCELLQAGMNLTKVVNNLPCMSKHAFSNFLSASTSAARRHSKSNSFATNACTAGMRPKICVIGGGIIGLSSAYKILQDIPNASVTVFSDKFSPNTTADISAGFIFPYACGGDQKQLGQWFKQTLDRLCQLYKREDSYEIGIAPLPGYLVDAEIPESVPRYFPDFRVVDKKEKELFVHCNEATHHLTTYTCECTKYLPWLMKQIQDLGGNLIEKHVNSFEDVFGFDFIINCTGIEAKQLIPNEDMQPDRGQVIVVRAPWVKFFLLYGEDTYILPRLADVVLGGTHQMGNYSLDTNERDKKDIFARCCELMPSLKYSEILGSKAGLRPRRSSVRLELVETIVKNKAVPVIHNYGHGGSGVTIHWGCAIQTSELVQKYLATNSLPKL